MRKQSDYSQQELRQLFRERGICVVIPTYNNVGSIQRVVTEAQQFCSDIIVVDDGSTDDTMATLRSIPGITIEALPHNRGKGHALLTGFRRALQKGFAHAITMDADGQHYASDLPRFLQANIDHPGSLIVGSRQFGDAVRSKGSVFANRLSNFWFFVQTGRRLPDTQTGFRPCEDSTSCPCSPTATRPSWSSSWELRGRAYPLSTSPSTSSTHPQPSV